MCLVRPTAEQVEGRGFVCGIGDGDETTFVSSLSLSVTM
jgi:hypothetical protein